MGIYADHPTDPELERVALQAAKQRLLHCFDKDIVPNIDDSTRVLQTAYDNMSRSGAPLDAPGQRLYLMHFEGPETYALQGLRSYVKVGIVEKRTFPERLKDYEREVKLYKPAVIFDGWVSKAWPNVRRWEKRACDALEALPGTRRYYREYFTGVTFERALEVVQNERTA